MITLKAEVEEDIFFEPGNLVTPDEAQDQVEQVTRAKAAGKAAKKYQGLMRRLKAAKAKSKEVSYNFVCR